MEYSKKNDDQSTKINIPIEIQEQGEKVIAEYLAQLDTNVTNDTNVINETRIIILGDKGAGKTSLARRLADPIASMPKEYESTEGVDVITWVLPNYQGMDSVNVYIWDFSGHVVTHAAHRLFLSERCLYIIVYDGRSEERNRLNYWLDQVRNFGKDAPVLILVNMRDSHKPDIPKNMLKAKYPFIKDFFYFSICNDEVDLDNFRTHIAEFIKNNPTWNSLEIPASYYKTMRTLERFFPQNNDYITMEQFNKIAYENGIQNNESNVNLLKDLHSLGQCLWYQDIDEFNTLILNPNWIAHGVYKIINWAHKCSMHTVAIENYDDIFEYEKDRYPKDKFAFILKLMEKYELAYSRNDNKIMLPFLLKTDRPLELPVFPIYDSLMIQYASEHPLPSDIISRLIVRHSDEIRNDTEVWRYGVILSYKSNTIALIEQNDRHIVIKVRGNDKSEYILMLRKTMNAIFDNYKSVSPELQYKVIMNEPIIIENYADEEILLSSETIKSHVKNGRPYFDAKSKLDIPLEATVKEYNIINYYNIVSGGNIQIADLNKTEPYEQEVNLKSKYVKQLKIEYQKDDLILVLGAGVSKSAKVPLWDDLIRKLLSEMIKIQIGDRNYTKEYINDMIQLAYGNMEDSPLAQMRYIKKVFSHDDYIRLIHTALYENSVDKTDLLEAIAQLCKPTRKHSGIKSIITYNFDNLIESTLKSNGIEHKSIYKAEDISESDNLNIYHVHGYLPKDWDRLSENVNLIFSEEDYHKVYREAYDWTNIQQLNSFRESTCLFIGCSLNDANLRRLLDAAHRKEESPRHYAILKKYVKEDDSNVDSKIITAYSSIDLNIREIYLRDFGINIIWINEYDEIPSIISGLKNKKEAVGK